MSLEGVGRTLVALTTCGKSANTASYGVKKATVPLVCEGGWQVSGPAVNVEQLSGPALNEEQLSGPALNVEKLAGLALIEG